LERIALDEDHCCVLGALSRPGLEIRLTKCELTDAAATALANLFGRNPQGPTKLDNCEIKNFVLADGLCGNSRLKSLRPHFSKVPEDGKREFLAIAGSLRENKGLLHWSLPITLE
jgi:hypothetical protein